MGDLWLRIVWNRFRRYTRRMKRRILLALSTVVGLLGQSSQDKDLTADELKGMLDKKVKLFFLDVREPKEIEELGSIEGYVNIPLSQLEARMKEIPKDVLIVAG